jgi:hypothetical protein
MNFAFICLSMPFVFDKANFETLHDNSQEAIISYGKGF